MLRWLREDKDNVDDGGPGVQALPARKEDRERRIWFQTDNEAVSDGLWSADGTFPIADMDALALMGLESVPGAPRRQVSVISNS